MLLVVVVVRLQHSPSKATTNAKVESMSAEWLVQGTTWRGCLFGLVSVSPRVPTDFVYWIGTLYVGYLHAKLHVN